MEKENCKHEKKCVLNVLDSKTGKEYTTIGCKNCDKEFRDELYSEEIKYGNIISNMIGF
ncbi:hypothetical protein LCGC14_0854920 [marine sediment metagenome]|uniref:Uncharacterized protein n=1 Tax=marine sediment metagenome TaxID=412755 RepID=A0A0F9RTR0_9ZZZZ